MVLGRFLSRRPKDHPYGPRGSTGSEFSVPDQVPPAYPVDGRFNKDNVVVDSKPFMPDFPIMANNAPEPPRSKLFRKPVGGQPRPEQQQPQVQPYPGSIPKPPYSREHEGGEESFYDHRDDSGHAQPRQVPPNIYPVSIPMPTTGKHETNTKSTRPTSFFGFGNGGSSSSSSNNNNSGSSSNNNSSRPNVDVPASEVRRCTKLLRRMYELQLDIWSMKFILGEDMPERLEKKRQADALLVEIQNMIQTWTRTTGASWSDEEMKQVAYISRHLDSLNQNKFW